MTSYLTALACPRCHSVLTEITYRAYVEQLKGQPLTRTGTPPTARPDTVLLCSRCSRAYPVLEGTPILLAPEALSSEPVSEDLTHPYYAEAYAEMEHYGSVAREQARHLESSPPFRSVKRSIECAAEGCFGLLRPVDAWLDQMPDTEAHWDAYSHLGDIGGAEVLQLGGKGTNVVRMLLAGAETGWLLTPMLGEVAFARSLADAAGVRDRFHAVVGVAEELPFREDRLDAVFTAGCLHHMQTGRVFEELARALRPGGRFSAVEPWRAPLYGIGTRIFGKREPNPFCRPLTEDRVRTFGSTFKRADVVHHGAFLRYPLIVAQKVGYEPRLATARRIMRFDDALASLLGVRRFGSCVALLAQT